MRPIVKLPFYALVASVLFTSGCVIAPDHDEHERDRDHAYQRHSDEADYRDHERREAYRHCREAGEHDCDDLLHHND